MKLWLTAVITASLFLSLISSLLPENGVKRAALTAFGFIFLGIMVSPVVSAINNGFSLDVLMLESIAETENSEGDDYISRVAEEYRTRLEEECENMLEIENFTPEISVGINEDTDGGGFGSILWVKCLLKEEATVDADKKSYVDKIVIDFHGIRAEEDDEDENIKEYTEETISDFLGIEREKVYVELG